MMIKKALQIYLAHHKILLIPLIKVALLIPSNVLSQDTTHITIDSCYVWARKNYPVIRQLNLIEKTRDYTIENASKGRLPQFVINGQATYQSEVTQIPIEVPGVEPISKDQYKIYGEITQPLTNGHQIRLQKALARSNAQLETDRTEVELTKLNERVNQIYFGILLMDAQLNQVKITRSDLQSTLKRTLASIENGTALRSNADMIEAEILNADQRTIELLATRNGFVSMLALLVNRESEGVLQLTTPGAKVIRDEINRPELKLYADQKRIFQLQEDLIKSRNIPQFNLFLQSGYARPALNFLDNDFKFYFLGGLRMGWNISSFYTSANERQVQMLNQSLQDTHRETFLFNTKLNLNQQSKEVEKFAQLLDSDAKIIALRKKVKDTASAQLANGTITTTDFLSFVNAEEKARQNQVLHQMQLLQAQYNHSTISGN